MDMVPFGSLDIDWIIYGTRSFNESMVMTDLINRKRKMRRLQKRGLLSQ